MLLFQRSAVSQNQINAILRDLFTIPPDSYDPHINISNACRALAPLVPNLTTEQKNHIVMTVLPRTRDNARQIYNGSYEALSLLAPAIDAAVAKNVFDVVFPQFTADWQERQTIYNVLAGLFPRCTRQDQQRMLAAVMDCLNDKGATAGYNKNGAYIDLNKALVTIAPACDLAQANHLRDALCAYIDDNNDAYKAYFFFETVASLSAQCTAESAAAVLNFALPHVNKPQADYYPERVLAVFPAYLPHCKIDFVIDNYLQAVIDSFTRADCLKKFNQISAKEAKKYIQALAAFAPRCTVEQSRQLIDTLLPMLNFPSRGGYDVTLGKVCETTCNALVEVAQGANAEDKRRILDAIQPFTHNNDQSVSQSAQAACEAVRAYINDQSKSAKMKV